MSKKKGHNSRIVWRDVVVGFDCTCGEELIIDDDAPTICPKCKKGWYVTIEVVEAKMTGVQED